MEVDIFNGRDTEPAFDAEGFELCDFPSWVTDWTDPVEVKRVHQPEVAAWVTERFGCDAVLFYPGIVRSPDAAEQSSDLGPIEVAHSDYSERYSPMLATPDHPYLDILAESMEAAGVTRGALAAADRVLTVQFWRNIGAARPDRPLALCDGRTVDRSEFVEYEVATYGGRPAGFESLLLMAADGAAGHDRRRWATFPEMSPDEVIVFRAYDSDCAAAGEPFWTPHAAFVDPTADADAPKRMSFEIRAICLFGL